MIQNSIPLQDGDSHLVVFPPQVYSSWLNKTRSSLLHVGHAPVIKTGIVDFAMSNPPPFRIPMFRCQMIQENPESI